MPVSKENPPLAAPDSFKNRTVIVSGATGKLGRVISTALANASANLVLNDINSDALQALADSLSQSSSSSTILAIPGSATDHASSIITQTLDKFGHIHALITPTLSPIPWNPIQNLSLSDFRSAFESNTLAPLALLRAAWPHFLTQNHGRVVNFTSDSLLGFPTASAYTMSKGALFGLNKTLAAEGAAHDIKVNCVSPIAYHENMARHIERFSPEVQSAFREMYAPEANVPMILALAHGGCEVSGEVVSTAGWAAGRCVWGVRKGVRGLRTVEECLGRMGEIVKKGGGEGGGGEEVFEPEGMVDFTEFQGRYVVGKE
ncbi:MAG: hypothetical protein Q9227_004066 [Pyrenula ochraceoflavens]